MSSVLTLLVVEKSPCPKTGGPNNACGWQETRAAPCSDTWSTRRCDGSDRKRSACQYQAKPSKQAPDRTGIGAHAPAPLSDTPPCVRRTSVFGNHRCTPRAFMRRQLADTRSPRRFGASAPVARFSVAMSLTKLADTSNRAAAEQRMSPAPSSCKSSGQDISGEPRAAGMGLVWCREGGRCPGAAPAGPLTCPAPPCTFPERPLLRPRRPGRACAGRSPCA